MIDRAPEEWFDRFDAALGRRRARRFPVESGRAWRLGGFVVHIEIENETVSAVAIAANERLGENGSFDSATATDDFRLQIGGEPREAARRVAARLRNL